MIFAEDVERIFGKRPWVSRSEVLLEAEQRAMAEAMAEKRARELEAEGKTLGEPDTTGQEEKEEHNH